MENNMPKPILIIGTERSGKSLAAKGVSTDYKETVVVDGSYWGQKTYLFQACRSNTDCVIIDELDNYKDAEHLYSRIKDGVRVQVSGLKSVVIYPKIVMVAWIGSLDGLQIVESVKEIFDIIIIGGSNV